VGRHRLREDIVDRIIELLSVVQYEEVVMDRGVQPPVQLRPRAVGAVPGPGTGKDEIAGLIAKERPRAVSRRFCREWCPSGWARREEPRQRVDEAHNATRSSCSRGDALFGSAPRSDRPTIATPTLETNYLLQRIESFEGIVLSPPTATPRSTSVPPPGCGSGIEFPRPTPLSRAAWRIVDPGGGAARAERRLCRARRAISDEGCYIKNAAMRAAYLAATPSRKMISRTCSRGPPP